MCGEMKRITIALVLAACLCGCRSTNTASPLVGSWQSDHLQVDGKKEDIRVECVFETNWKVKVTTVSDFAGMVHKSGVYSINKNGTIRVHVDEPNTPDLRLKLQGNELHLATELYHPGSNSVARAVLRKKGTSNK
jgi:hypothetical protein